MAFDASCRAAFSGHTARGADGAVIDEAEAGISAYVVADRRRGLGGQIKVDMDDFRVREIPASTPSHYRQFFAASVARRAESQGSPPPDRTSRSAVGVQASEAKRRRVAVGDALCGSGRGEEACGEGAPVPRKRPATTPEDRATGAGDSGTTTSPAGCAAGVAPGASPSFECGFRRTDDIVWFQLTKRGVDTLEAISQLAAATYFPTSAFGFAGIKDSFAVTTQTLSLRLPCEEAEARAFPHAAACNLLDRDPSRTLRNVLTLFHRAGFLQDDSLPTPGCAGERNSEVAEAGCHGASSPASPGASFFAGGPLRAGERDDDVGSVVSALESVGHIQVHDFRFGVAPLFPGNLVGNWFRLAIRNSQLARGAIAGAGDAPLISGGEVRSTRAHVDSLFSALRERGFVNYIGLQRFGKNGVRSDTLGLHYLRGDYVKCFEILLRVDGVGRPRFGVGNGSLHRWAETFRRVRCAETALSQMPDISRLWQERRLLVSFMRVQVIHDACTAEGAVKVPEQQRREVRKRWRPEDADGAEDSPTPLRDEHRQTTVSYADKCRCAFLSLPRFIRVLYAHAYLDRIWNLAASERVRRYGSKDCVVGDLVLLEEDDLRVSGVSAETLAKRGFLKHRRGWLRVLKAATDCFHFTIFDVVLPRLGFGHFDGAAGMAEHAEDHGAEGACGAGDFDAPPPEDVTLEEASWDDDHALAYHALPEDPALLPEHCIGQLMREYVKYDGIESLGVEMHVSRETLECTFYWQIPGDYRYVLARPQELTWSLRAEPAKDGSKPATGCDAVVETDFWLKPGTYATMAMRELLVSRSAPPPHHVVFDEDSD